MTILLGSSAASPTSSNGSPPWNPRLAEAGRELSAALAGVDPAAFQRALATEGLRRLDRFAAGVMAYRRHPYRRTLADPPVAWRQGGTRLLDYGGAGPPVLLVPSLVNRAYILDLSERRSLARYLAGRGFHPMLVDWGAPGPDEAAFTLTDYVAGRLEAMLEVAAADGPVLLAGYCMGGQLALAAAGRRPELVRGLALLATPWDYHAGDGGAGGGAGRMLATLRAPLERIIDEFGAVPVDILQALFAGLDPTLSGRKFRSFAGMDANTVKARDFVALEDWSNDGVPLVAGVARDCLFGWYGANQPVRGQWLIDGRPVLPSLVRCPALVMVPSRDRLVPPRSALALAASLGRVNRRTVRAGHVGMMAGGRAKTEGYGPLAKWLWHVAQQ